MLHTLQVALAGLITDERMDVLLDSVRLIQDAGLSAPIDEVQEVIEIQNSFSDNTLLVARITDTLYLGVTQILTELGVTCTDEVELVERNAILLTVSLLEHYIIPEHLIGLMGGEFNSEEIIAHMVPVFTTVTMDEALHALLEVDPRLIEKLREVLERSLQLRSVSDADLLPDNTARIAAINRLITAVGVERVSIAMELADAGVRAGRPLSGLLTNYTESLEDLPLEHVTSELLALVLFSNHPVSELKPKLLELINDFTDQPYQQKTMTETLNQLLTKIGQPV